MSTATLRKWGGAVAVSLPKKILSLLGLRPGSEVEVDLEDGRIVLAPARPRLSLAKLEREQRDLEKRLGGRPVDTAWLDSAPRGKEAL